MSGSRIILFNRYRTRFPSPKIQLGQRFVSSLRHIVKNIIRQLKKSHRKMRKVGVILKGIFAAIKIILKKEQRKNHAIPDDKTAYVSNPQPFGNSTTEAVKQGFEAGLQGNCNPAVCNIEVVINLPSHPENSKPDGRDQDTSNNHQMRNK
jgi:hypothetical protein